MAKAWTNNDARHTVQLFGNVRWRNLLAIDKVNPCFDLVVDSRQNQALADALIGILQIVLTHKPYVHFLGGVALLLQKNVPRFHGWRLANRYSNFAQDSGVKPLALHAHRYFIDARHILALHYTF